MTNTPVYVDTILQVFSSNGNLHLIGGCSTGSVDSSGKDMVNQTLHLVIPFEYALEKISELNAVLPGLSESSRQLQPKSAVTDTVKQSEFEGHPIQINLKA